MPLITWCWGFRGVEASKTLPLCSIGALRLGAVNPRPRALALGNLTALADAHRLDAVVAHRLHADRVAVGGDRVAALWQTPELREHEAPTEL